MAYYLNGQNIQNAFGFIPIRQEGSTLALSGFLDMPARLGKCFHRWGNDHGVEPYTSAEDIRYGGRDLKLTGCIQGTDKLDCLNKMQAFINRFNLYDGLINFITDWAVHEVYVKEPIIGEYLSDLGLKVTLIMREPLVLVGGIAPAATPLNEYGIDGITWATLGGELIDFAGDRRNRTASKEVSFTSWQYEGYKVTPFTQEGKISLKIAIIQPTWSDFLLKIQGISQVFSKPGERNLLVKGDLLRRVFACDGYKFSNIWVGDTVHAILDIDLIQSELPREPIYLGDNAGNYIVDNSNNKILIKWV